MKTKDLLIICITTIVVVCLLTDYSKEWDKSIHKTCECEVKNGS